MADIIVTGNTIPTVTTRDRLFFAGGNVPVTTGLDLSGLASGVSFVSIDSGRTGNIGTVATPLKLDMPIATDRFVNRASGGTLYLEADNQDIIVYTHLGSGSAVLSGTNEYDRVEVAAGNVTIGGTVDITAELLVTGGNVVVEQGADIATLTITGGSVTLRGDTNISPSTTYLIGGSLIVDGGSPGNLVIYGGNLILLSINGTNNIAWINGDFNIGFLQKPISFNDAIVNVSLPSGLNLLNDSRVTISGTTTRYFEGNV